MHKGKRIKITLLIGLLLIIVLGNLVIAQDHKNAYVIPIKGEINKATYQFVKARLQEITEDNPSAIIFEIDTYGGLISEAEKITKLIMDLDVPTISFVNTKAESAGVLITISGEKIAMAEGSTIGSAETIPNTEKIMSMWVNWLRTTAEDRGRDSELVAAMADKELEIQDLVKKGELLNLNYKQALDLGLADIISNNYEDILDSFNIQYNELIIIEKDFKSRLAQYIVNPYVVTLLLAMGFIGFLIEIFTPGFGAGGTIAFLSFGLFFGGNLLAGNSNLGAVILFVVGVILLLIEAIIPGFGVPGIGGIVSIIISIIMASGSPKTAVISLSVAIILTVVTAVVMVKYGARSPYLNKIILTTKQENKTGYTSTKTMDEYISKEGMVLSTLRPAGIIQIGDERIDAVSEGSFIKKGEKIKVIKIEGRRVVVKKVN